MTLAANSNGEYRTKNLSLATYLNMEGHTHQRLERQGRQCTWVFFKAESLDDLVRLFLDGEAEVEPNAYTGELHDVRNEMYEFLRSVS